MQISTWRFLSPDAYMHIEKKLPISYYYYISEGVEVVSSARKCAMFSFETL